MTVQIVSDERNLLLLQPEWDALWSAVESPCYNQSFTYARLCWKEMWKHKRARLRCIVIRESGQAVLIWPLIVTRLALLRVLKPLGAEAAEYTEPLVKGGPEAFEICSRAWSAARSLLKADIINMPLVKDGSCLHAVLSNAGAFSVDRDLCYVAKWDKERTDWDTYYKTIGVGHNLRSDRRIKRRLAEQGTIEFQVLECSGEDAAMIDWCLQQKREWAERVNKRGGWLYSNGFRNLLVGLFAQELDQRRSSQRYVIFLLRLNGAPIAAKLAACNHVKLEGIMASFDARWGKYSPGSLLDEYHVRWVFDRSLELDFGVGTEPYKKFWSNNNAIPTENYRFAGSVLGRLALEARQWRLSLARPKPSESKRGKGAPSVKEETAGSRE